LYNDYTTTAKKNIITITQNVMANENSLLK